MEFLGYYGKQHKLDTPIVEIYNECSEYDGTAGELTRSRLVWEGGTRMRLGAGTAAGCPGSGTALAAAGCVLSPASTTPEHLHTNN